MVKFEGKIDTLYQIFTPKLLPFLMLKNVFLKNSPHDVQTKGGGGGSALRIFFLLNFLLCFVISKISKLRDVIHELYTNYILNVYFKSRS